MFVLQSKKTRSPGGATLTKQILYLKVQQPAKKQRLCSILKQVICVFFKSANEGETIHSFFAPGFWEAAEDDPDVSVDRKALTWQKKEEKNLKAVDRHWERIWHRELSHDGVNCLFASLSASQLATWGHLQRFDHCQAVKIFCCNSVLTLLLPRFGLVASAAAVLGRCWVLSALWVVSDPPSQYKPPLGGRNKVSSSSSRHQALFVNWTLADVAKAKDGTLSAIARVGWGEFGS